MHRHLSWLSNWWRTQVALIQTTLKISFFATGSLSHQLLRWIIGLKSSFQNPRRIFLDSSLEVVRQLLSWFESANLRDRVTRILLLWVLLSLSIFMTFSLTSTSFQVNNHFTDFELDSDMMELLDGFESRLESAKMQVPGENNNI